MRALRFRRPFRGDALSTFAAVVLVALIALGAIAAPLHLGGDPRAIGVGPRLVASGVLVVAAQVDQGVADSLLVSGIPPQL